MGSDYFAIVSSVYLAYYGRPGDPAGVAWWREQLEQMGGDLAAMIDAFATSAEATQRFASLTASEQITQIYQDLLSRDPESAGLAYWADEVESGRRSLSELALSISDGAQGGDRTLVDARQQVAEEMTRQLDAQGEAYEGQEAIDAARLVIQSVNADTSADDAEALASMGVELVGLASAAPAVIQALAGDGPLTALINGERGAAEPVGLIKLLTSTAGIAKGNAKEIKALLGEGSLADYLAALPKETSLDEAGKIIGKKGLGAGVDAGGDGDDILHVSLGDTLTGGVGKDTFIIESDSWAMEQTDQPPAVITDFTLSDDVLDISALVGEDSRLIGYTGGNPFDPDLGYLSLEQVGDDTLLQIDRDGAAGTAYESVTLVKLLGVNASDIQPSHFTPELELAVSGGTDA